MEFNMPDADWKLVLVCVEVRHDFELELFKKKGVVVHRYEDILKELDASSSQVNSTAGNIVEILRYMKKD